MTANTISDMKELRNITKELKDMGQKMRALRVREKELKSNILTYLQNTNQPGVRFDELVVMQDEKFSHLKKNKKEREECIIQTLEQAGISDSKAVYDSIQNASKGEIYTARKLKVKLDFPELSV